MTLPSVLPLILASTVLSTIATAAPEADWPAYGGDAGGTRYSPLAQITPANVGELRVAWTFRTGELGQGVKDWKSLRLRSHAHPLRRHAVFHHQQHGCRRGERG